MKQKGKTSFQERLADRPGEEENVQMPSQTLGATGTNEEGVMGVEWKMGKGWRSDGEHKGKTRKGHWGRETIQAAASVKTARQGRHGQNWCLYQGVFD